MDTSSRVLQPLNNRPDACTERDVVSNLKASKKAGKHTVRRASELQRAGLSHQHQQQSFVRSNRVFAPLLTTSMITHKLFAEPPCCLQAGEAVARFESRYKSTAVFQHRSVFEIQPVA